MMGGMRSYLCSMSMKYDCDRKAQDLRLGIVFEQSATNGTSALFHIRFINHNELARR